MSDTGSSLSPLRREDYEAIEAAVMETARGRWFLAEYARRHRVSDTTTVLDAIGRLEKIVKRERSVPDMDRIRLDLADMAHAIERTKDEIAQIKHHADDNGKFARATDELDAIVNQTERATSEILTAAEHIQELAWTLREEGADSESCDKLDTFATEIYTACSFQDLTGQRTQKVVHVLKYLENRIMAMTEIWGIEDLPEAKDTNLRPGDTRADAHLLNGPQLEGEGIDQSDIDALISDGDIIDMVEFDTIETPSDDIAYDAAPDAAPVAAAAADAVEAEIAENAGIEAETLAEDVFDAAEAAAEGDIEMVVAAEAVSDDFAAEAVAEGHLDAEWTAEESAASADQAAAPEADDDPTVDFTRAEKTAIFI
ncbi:MAG: protein phosphatase CheZ [Hyphomicrobiales bacterium]